MRKGFDFCVRRSMDAVAIEGCVKGVLRRVSKFVSAADGNALWRNARGDCVFLTGYFGTFEGGDRVGCAEMPRIVGEWAAHLAELLIISPVSDIDKVGYGMKGENAYEADRICRIELSCPDKPAGLTIRALTDEGQVFDEIVFARTLKDGGELP